MELLLALQSRIPDRWFLRRLLPSALFVALAVVAGGLGQAHGGDLRLAVQRLADHLGAAQAEGASARLTAVWLLYAIGAAAGAFAAPVVAQLLGTVAAGGFPWWLAPVGERVRRRRVARWRAPDELLDDALRARGRGEVMRAARLEARAVSAPATAPTTPTWSGDRLRAAADRVREVRGLDVENSWVRLLLDLPEASRTALLDARDGYDAAAEAMAWSLAFLVLGCWWWPGVLVGAVLGLAAWRWLRHAVVVLASTVEVVAEAAGEKAGEKAGGSAAVSAGESAGVSAGEPAAESAEAS
ncbi:hypothetical protein ACIBCA_18700 [Kitasatospora sp. NPDC051170]|uniref:hypothetical protein n=1 Tax=Kitasatospora sp. NPDC051170 TaxID=3364056 RepID=UPI003792532F